MPPYSGCSALSSLKITEAQKRKSQLSKEESARARVAIKQVVDGCMESRHILEQNSSSREPQSRPPPKGLQKGGAPSSSSSPTLSGKRAFSSTWKGRCAKVELFPGSTSSGSFVTCLRPGSYLDWRQWAGIKWGKIRENSAPGFRIWKWNFPLEVSQTLLFCYFSRDQCLFPWASLNKSKSGENPIFAQHGSHSPALNYQFRNQLYYFVPIRSVGYVWCYDVPPHVTI